MLRRGALLAAFVLCVGTTGADVHLPLDDCEEEVCTLCAPCEPGYVPELGRFDARPSEWRRSNPLPACSATLPPRSYEAGSPRAPPVS